MALRGWGLGLLALLRSLGTPSGCGFLLGAVCGAAASSSSVGGSSWDCLVAPCAVPARSSGALGASSAGGLLARAAAAERLLPARRSWRATSFVVALCGVGSVLPPFNYAVERNLEFLTENLNFTEAVHETAESPRPSSDPNQTD